MKIKCHFRDSAHEAEIVRTHNGWLLKPGYSLSFFMSWRTPGELANEVPLVIESKIDAATRADLVSAGFNLED